MPELLAEGLPERRSRSRIDFAKWADGEAWKFVKGEDYQSSTETFRYNVRRWAKAHGYDVECRPFPALDANGNEIPMTKADPIALGVCFTLAGGDDKVADLRSRSTRETPVAATS